MSQRLHYYGMSWGMCGVWVPYTYVCLCGMWVCGPPLQLMSISSHTFRRIVCFSIRLGHSLWAKALATDVFLRLVVEGEQETADSAFRMLKTMESHGGFEGHLPNAIPLSYVRKIYVPEKDENDEDNDWASLETAGVNAFGQERWQQIFQIEPGRGPANKRWDVPDNVLAAATRSKMPLEGYVFTLPPQRGRLMCMPQQLQKPEEGGHCYIRAKCDGVIFVVLSSDVELDADYVTIGISVRRGGYVYVCRKRKAGHHEDILQNQRYEAILHNFDDGCNWNDIVDYHVSWERQRRNKYKICVTHFGRKCIPPRTIHPSPTEHATCTFSAYLVGCI